MQRSQGLDLLRFLAIALVLGRHIPSLPEHAPAVASGLVAFVIRGGWQGVDLFFVLSGFLVSGLLYRDFQRSGAIDAKRFLIRRGFRIYPPFWLLVAAGVAYDVLTSTPLHLKRLGVELLFLQSYFYTGTMFGHTWSLAIEEHFYLLLVIVLVCLTRFTKTSVKAVPWLFAAMAVLCLVSRVATRAWGPDDPRASLFETHNRIDSLFLGVFLSYVAHFDPARFGRWVSRRTVLLTLGFLALLPGGVVTMEHSTPMLTIGLSTLAAGSGCLVVALVGWRSEHWLFRSLAYLGSHSYSIYLWNGGAVPWMLPWLHRVVGSRSWWLEFLIYLSVSLGAGVLLAVLTETPVLRLRDALFPDQAAPARVRARVGVSPAAGGTA